MAHHLVDYVFEHYNDPSQMKMSEHALLLAMAYIGENCFASQSIYQKLTCIKDEDTIGYAAAALENKGIIRKVSLEELHKNGIRGRRSNTYQLLFADKVGKDDLIPRRAAKSQPRKTGIVNPGKQRTNLYT